MTFVDIQGNSVDRPHRRNSSLLSSCSYDLPDYADLKQYVRIFHCESSAGYKIQWQFKLSWNNTVVLVNPYNSALKTKGNLLIINSTTGVTQFNYTTYNVKIDNLGADPVNPSNTIFFVRFTCDNIIPSDYINGGIAGTYFVRLGETFVSDCSSPDNYAIAPSDPAGYGISPGTSTNPCNRIEKAYFQPPGAIAASKFGVAGADLVGSSCGYINGSFNRPSLQEVSYSLNNGSTWNDFSNYTAPNTWGIYQKRYLGFSDIAQSPILHGTYNIVIRYKNWTYNSPQSSYPVPTSSNACATYTSTVSDPNYSNSFAYEYYPNTVLP